MSEQAAPAADNVPEYSVSELALSLKRTVEDAYGFVRVRGELGRVTLAKSGHLYVDLKDEKSVIASVMWKGAAGRLNFRPEEGLEVVCEGKLSTYPGRSQYQLIIERMSPAGAGALMALLEQRKQKLAAEGLFAAERKRPIPRFPEVVGVVTSPTGAVIRDILHRIAERYPRHVLVWPALVQGEQAAAQVAAGIVGFNQFTADGATPPRPDVLIVARGGGSIEDLWPFNEEVVVRAAAGSTIPLISAVGHETDWTLIDLASDLRAPTPTGAAELVTTPPRAELAAAAETFGGRLARAVLRTYEARASALKAAARGLPRPEDLLGQRQQRLDMAGERLRSGLKGLSDASAIRFQRTAARLRPEALGRDVEARRARVNEFAARLETAHRRLARDHAKGLEAVGARLESLNPKAVLGRGYALVRASDGGLAPRAAALSPGDAISIEFADGAREAVVSGAQGSDDGGGRRGPFGRKKAPKRGKDETQGSLL